MTSFLRTSKFEGQKASEGSLCKILCLSATEKLKPENAKPSTKAKKRDDKGDISEAKAFLCLKKAITSLPIPKSIYWRELKV